MRSSIKYQEIPINNQSPVKKTTDYKISCYFILGRRGTIEKVDFKMFVEPFKMVHLIEIIGN